MGKWHKGRWTLVTGLLLAASVGFASSLSAEQPATATLAQNPVSVDSAAATDESSNSKDSVENENNNQGAPLQPSAEQFGDPARPATQVRNAQMAVNPVTGLVPVSALDYVPLTGKQRWKVYWKQTYFSYGAYFKPVMFALVLDQTTNSPSQWGGGFSGFGLRVASRTGNSIIQGTIRAPLAAALHEDVRYVYSGRHNGARRLLYAVEYSFLTYNDRHHPTLNIAKIVGYYASTAISTQWHPPGHSVASYTFTNGSEQLGLSVPINILQEFWPSISRWLTHLH